jgi:predicted RNA-binding protein with PIN domain
VPRTIIVDGYNVIRRTQWLSALESTSLELARDSLIRGTIAAPRFAQDDVRIIFDGRSRPGANVSTGSTRVQVAFTTAQETADDAIKRAASSSTSPGSLVVVTDDQDIRLYCIARGCAVATVESFASAVQGGPKRPKPRSQPYADRPDGSKKGNARRPRKSRASRGEHRF